MYRRLFWKNITVVMGILWCLSARVDAGESLPVMIYAPAGPTSIPLILAAESLPGVKVKIFSNHSKAHALFLKGKVQILCTGLAVGVGFYRQGVAVQIINSHVSGLAWLVTSIKVTHFKDLRGMTIYLPFPGSPLEELTRFFMAAEQLEWNHDVHIRYTPFPGAVALLQQHRISVIALPEPFVSQVLTPHNALWKSSGDTSGQALIHDPDETFFPSKKQRAPLTSPGFYALSYKAVWERHTGSPHGYPQVGCFVHREFARTHGTVIQKFNLALARSIQCLASDPDPAVKRAGAYMDFPGELLRRSLERTDFHLWHGAPLRQVLLHYYQTIGDPLNETFDTFF